MYLSNILKVIPIVSNVILKYVLKDNKKNDRMSLINGTNLQ